MLFFLSSLIVDRIEILAAPEPHAMSRTEIRPSEKVFTRSSGIVDRAFLGSSRMPCNRQAETPYLVAKCSNVSSLLSPPIECLSFCGCVNATKLYSLIKCRYALSRHGGSLRQLSDQRLSGIFSSGIARMCHRLYKHLIGYNVEYEVIDIFYKYRRTCYASRDGL